MTGADDASYWRRDTPRGPIHYRLDAVGDWILRDGAWHAVDLPRHGPSWWRLTGDADRIRFDELPPGTPR